MHSGYEISQAGRYIARAHRNIALQRWRAQARSSNQQTAATAESLVELLTAMLKNVERNRATAAVDSDFRSRLPGRAAS